jgi:hypothetical protein
MRRGIAAGQQNSEQREARQSKTASPYMHERLQQPQRRQRHERHYPDDKLWPGASARTAV